MKTPSPPPPKFFHRFFRWFCDPEMIDYIEGDLMEVYTTAFKKSGKKKADLVFIAQVIKLFRPGIIRPIRTPQHHNNSGMIKSYFTTGWRNLWRSKLHSALNIVGLTMGMVCFLLIGLYVFDEMTYDQQHTNADRIYRVIQHKTGPDAMVIAASGYRLAGEAMSTIPEVENATRLQRIGRANLVNPENPVNFQETVTIADEHFLEILDFPFIIGDQRKALKEPNSIIINEDLAMRLFGRIDVIGKHLKFGHWDYVFTVTGILKNHQRNSSFTFNSIVSENTLHADPDFKEGTDSDWASPSVQVYTLLRPNSSPEYVSDKITKMILNHFKPEAGTDLFYSLQSLPDMHLKSEGIVDGARNTNVDAIPQGNPLYISIFSFTAIFVLLISGINYTNLTTARASGRTKEIGVRKAIGAVRNNLVNQFLFESLLTTMISFIVAILVTNLILPFFNHFTGKELSLGLATDYRFWLLAFTSIIIISLLSGSYAAVLLSGLKPAALLKGIKLRTSDQFVRKGLVVFQFTISIIMIIATMVLFLQVRYLNNSDLGFNKDLMVIVDINTGTARSDFETIKDQMSKVPSVKSVSVSSRIPGEWKEFRTIKIKMDGSANEHMIFYVIGADREFMHTYEMDLLQGRNFESKNDSTAIILNETAAKMLGVTEASGQLVEIPSRSRGSGFTSINDENIPFKPRVIGIVKDFHFQSLRDKIEPLVLAYNNNPLHAIDYYSVRIESQNIEATLDQLKQIMVRSNQNDPFEYHFLDDQLALFYVEDDRRQTLLTWAASSTILIACLGLFGLATYSTEQRVKEIGIRKVLGASVPGVIGLLSKDFIKLVLISNVIAIPVAWWATNRWLQEYAYHIEVSWWIFFVAAVLAVGIAFATISYQALKAAIANPVNSLRSE